MATRNKIKIIVEAKGELLLGNVWAGYTRIVHDGDWWAVIEKDGWSEVFDGMQAENILSELLRILEKTLRRGGQSTQGVPRVDWLRVEAIE